MSRRMTFVNMSILQNIINREQELKSWDNHTDFFKHCSTQYNLICPLQPITHSIVRLRYEAGAVTTTVKPGRKGVAKGSKLTPEHKEKLHSGRDTKGRRKRFPAMDANAVNLLRQQWKDDPSALAMINKLAKPHRLKDKIRWQCYHCMGGSRTNVKNCTSPSCIWYEIRPWRKSS